MLPGCAVELTIWDHEKLLSNEFLGGVRLNLGTGVNESGVPVDWMDAHPEEVRLWQSMLERPDTWIEGTLGLRTHMTKAKGSMAPQGRGNSIRSNSSLHLNSH